MGQEDLELSQFEDSDAPTEIEEDEEECLYEILDEILNRVSVVEQVVDQHEFSLYAPGGTLHLRTRSAGSFRQTAMPWPQLFRSIGLGSAAVLLGCVVAADISVDAAQHNRYADIAFGASCVGAFSVVMWGATHRSEDEN